MARRRVIYIRRENKQYEMRIPEGATFEVAPPHPNLPRAMIVRDADGHVMSYMERVQDIRDKRIALVEVPESQKDEDLNPMKTKKNKGGDIEFVIPSVVWNSAPIPEAYSPISKDDEQFLSSIFSDDAEDGLK